MLSRNALPLIEQDQSGLTVIVMSSKWRIRFGVRFLIVCVFVVCVAAAWFGWRIRRGQRQHQAALAITQTASIVLYDYQFDNQGFFISGTPPQPPYPEWCRRLVGDHAFASIHRMDLSANFSDKGAHHLQHLYTLQKIDLSHREISDDSLEYLAKLTSLRELDLSSTKITDAGVRSLQRLHQLKSLRLGDTAVGDPGVEFLKGLKQLENLDLGGTSVSDAGLAHLAHLTNLKTLGLRRTQVSDEGLKHLRHLSKLRRLDLGREVSLSGLEQVAGLKQLRSLGLPGRESFNRQAIAYLRRSGRSYLDALEMLGHKHQSYLRLREFHDEDLASLCREDGVDGITKLILVDSPITDAGVASLRTMTELKRLELDGTQVTDACIVHLANLKKLVSLSFDHDAISERGEAELREKLPQLWISRVEH